MSGLKDFVISAGLQIEDQYKVEPEGHYKAFWQHLDGTTSKYIDIDDMHLINIFIMIKRNISFYEDTIRLENMNEHAMGQLLLFKEQYAYASYEVHKRGLFVLPKKDYEDA